MKKAFARQLEIEQKINAALRGLGLTFAEGFRLVEYNPEIPTAGWRYHAGTGEESIELGDAIVNLPVKQIEMVLRHEFLHRSVYHGFQEQFDDPVISNIALDICINRLLYEAFPDDMMALSKAVYPAESKITVIALADCSADPFKLKEPLKSMYHSIWEASDEGGFQYLNPASLYFKLLHLRDDPSFGLNPFSDFSRLDPEFDGNVPERIVKAGSKVAQGIGRKLPSGSSGAEGLNQYSVIPQQIGISLIEQFIRRINVRTIASKFARKIKMPLESHTIMQTYPMYPTRLGYIYQVFGLTEVLRLYWNRETGLGGARMAIAIYIDVSGSMVRHYPLIAGFVDTLRDYPIRIYSFDTRVRPVDPEIFSKGHITGGGGTDFNCFVLDFLANDELAAALVFTDGYGEMSDLIGKKLGMSGKNIYAVFLEEGEDDSTLSRLKKFARDSLVIQVKDSYYIIKQEQILWANS